MATEKVKNPLLPENAVGGGSVPDGRYIMKNCVAQEFTYPNTNTTVGALIVLFVDKTDPAVSHEQPYSLGGNDPSARIAGDGKHVIAVGKDSNAMLFIESLLKAGFPKADLSDDVTVFDGCDVEITNIAQKKRPGLKDQTEGKTIALVSKYHGKVGKAGHMSGASAPAKSQSAAQTAAPDNGNVPNAIPLIQEILKVVPENTMTRVKLATQVMLRASKDAALRGQMTALKAQADDPSWLIEHADAGNFTTDGETVILNSI